MIKSGDVQFPQYVPSRRKTQTVILPSFLSVQRTSFSRFPATAEATTAAAAAAAAA